MTKIEKYESLIHFVETSEDWSDTEFTRNDAIDFLEKEMTQIEKRAESAKKYAEKKKGRKNRDGLAMEVYDVILHAESPLSIAHILEAIAPRFPDASSQKVAWRLSAFCKEGLIEKSVASIKGETGTRRVNVYQKMKTE